MKKLTSLIIASCIVLSSLCLLVSCSKLIDIFPSNPDKTSIIKPNRGQYTHPLVSFESQNYERPQVDEIVASIKGVAEQIEGGIEFDVGVELIKSIEVGYTEVNTMYTIAEINYMRNTTDEYWSDEYDYMSASYPTFSEALEDLFVACAQSVDRERYEKEYFEYSLEEYVNGGVYNDTIVELMQTEAALEAEYMEITETTVSFTYDGITGTYEEIMAEIAKKYDVESEEYAAIEEECYNLLYTTLKGKWRPIFIELLKVRRLIADEMGYDSYTDYAYSAMGYEYSSDDMLKLLEGMKETVYPVYATLYERALRSYFYNNEATESPYYKTANNLYEVYSDIGGVVDDAYSYMLECELYDIKTADVGRYNGAFTAYIEAIEAPFLFMTAEQNITDYLTLAHEYGHFLDGYINGSNSASLDLSEVSSQAMELMTISRLRGILSDEEVQFLEYYQMFSALDVLLTQGLFSAFEHLVYELEYDEITVANVNRAAKNASKIIFGANFYTDCGDMLIQHTVVYPHYVQSYCTSQISSLEIFFIEDQTAGEGMRVYLDLVTRDSEEYLTLGEELKNVGLSSPFDPETLKRVVDAVHYKILGSHYFIELGGANAA